MTERRQGTLRAPDWWWAMIDEVGASWGLSGNSAIVMLAAAGHKALQNLQLSPAQLARLEQPVVELVCEKCARLVRVDPGDVEIRPDPHMGEPAAFAGAEPVRCPYHGGEYWLRPREV